MTINRSVLFKDAWKIYRKGKVTFGDALRRAWVTAKAYWDNVARVEDAKKAAGIEEETRTWYGWKVLGFEVRHESKCLFQVRVVDGGTKSGWVTKSYFGASQVEPIAA